MESYHAWFLISGVWIIAAQIESQSNFWKVMIGIMAGSFFFVGALKMFLAAL